MALARKYQINLADTPYYHCIGRCVRRAFLYGNDPLTERSYDHRKVWFINQLESLCTVFAIKVCAYAVMSNHYHLVLCVEPEAVNAWSDDEIILRIKHLNTLRIYGTFAKTDEDKPKKIYSPEEIEFYRKKLIDISSFMGALNEYLARRANQEDDCKGAFWEARFKSMALLDDAALLACMAYVDLNPVRAGMAASLEESDFTSIQERIKLHQPQGLTEEKPHSVENPGLKQHLGIFAHRNATQKPHIPCSWEEYKQLVEWTGRQIRGDNTASLAPESKSLLDAFAIPQNEWLANTKQLETRYSWAVGSVEKLKLLVKKKGLHWIRGIKNRIALPTNQIVS